MLETMSSQEASTLTLDDVHRLLKLERRSPGVFTDFLTLEVYINYYFMFYRAANVVVMRCYKTRNLLLQLET
jgi:hypothetical protein